MDLDEQSYQESFFREEEHEDEFLLEQTQVINAERHLLTIQWAHFF